MMLSYAIALKAVYRCYSSRKKKAAAAVVGAAAVDTLCSPVLVWCCVCGVQIEGHTICALGDAAAWPVQGLIRHFR